MIVPLRQYVQLFWNERRSQRATAWQWRLRWVALLAVLRMVLSMDSSALAARPDDAAVSSRAVPVLLVHGIFSTASAMEPLRQALTAQGLRAEAMTLQPSDGTVSLAVLAPQVEAAVEALRRDAHVERIDVVGHSMGALVLRYWLQRMNGRQRVRRFVSLSGPHRGVVGAFVSTLPAAREMRPHSAFLLDLAAEREPLGEVEAFDFYTPMDAIVVPATRQQLPGALVRKGFAVRSHHAMLTDKRVLAAVSGALRDGASAFPSSSRTGAPLRPPGTGTVRP